jgi:hypothetical protein
MGPLAVACMPTSKRSHPKTVRVQAVAEVEVLNIYRVWPPVLLVFVRLLYSHRHDPPQVPAVLLGVVLAGELV